MTYGETRRQKEAAAMAKGIWSDSCLFYLKYHGRQMEADTWQVATKDFGEIMRKYGGAPLCGRLMLAAFSQLEEETR